MKFSKHKSLIETIELGKRYNDRRPMFESWVEERSVDRKENNVSLGEGTGTLIPLGSAPHEMTIKILDRFGLF